MNVDARLFGLILQALRRRLGDVLLSPEVVNHLRDRRQELGLSLRAICERTELSLTFLSDVCNGKQLPGAGSLLRLCRVLGLSADDLLGVKED